MVAIHSLPLIPLPNGRTHVETERVALPSALRVGFSRWRFSAGGIPPSVFYKTLTDTRLPSITTFISHSDSIYVFPQCIPDYIYLMIYLNNSELTVLSDCNQ